MTWKFRSDLGDRFTPKTGLHSYRAEDIAGKFSKTRLILMSRREQLEASRLY